MSLFSLDPDAIQEMIGDENSPVEMQMKRLRAWLRNALQTCDESGKPNDNVIYHQGTYNMGENAIHIGMLAFKNQLKLSALNSEYRQAKKKVYENIHNTKMKWIPSAQGESIMVEGDPNLSALKERCECQEQFVKFLESMQDLIRYYPRNADALVRVHNFGQEIGQIIVGVRDKNKY
jgi:hypothetical protein